jgi:hypothetical protein
MIVSTQWGFSGAKLVEKESGSGNVITEKTELEVDRELAKDGHPLLFDPDKGIFLECYKLYPTGIPEQDYINFTKEAEFEYMPVSYQTGTYDQKWVEKLCVQNYKIGAVLTEMYTHAEHLQKTTEVKTRLYENWDFLNVGGTPCCTGVLEANLNSNVIGVAHIGWISRDPEADIQLKVAMPNMAAVSKTSLASSPSRSSSSSGATPHAEPSALTGCPACKFTLITLFFSILIWQDFCRYV